MEHLEFVVTRETNKYFISSRCPMVEKVCPRYSYGALGKLAMCEIYDNPGHIHIPRFTNYVARYCAAETADYVAPYRGLGCALLKSVILQLLATNRCNYDTVVELGMVNHDNKKLMQYYRLLSFAEAERRTCRTTVGDFLNATVNVPTYHLIT